MIFYLYMYIKLMYKTSHCFDCLSIEQARETYLRIYNSLLNRNGLVLF